jgi:predicted DNA-binding protein (MmcQ/YjbR family)
MNIESLRALALSYPGVTEDIKWETHLCFCVGGKIFIITSPDEVPVRASIKVSEEDFDLLTSRIGIIQAPYLGKRQWVSIENIESFSPQEWEMYLKRSYDLIFAKLTKKLQQEILSA